MVNVTHNNNYGSSLNTLAVIIAVIDKSFLDSNDNFLLDLCAKLFGNERSGIEINYLIDSAHLAETHKLLDDLGSCDLKA